MRHLSLVLWFVMLPLVYAFGRVYPAADAAFTPTFFVDLLVLGGAGFVLANTGTQLGSALSFRLGLRRAMKAEAQ